MGTRTVALCFGALVSDFLIPTMSFSTHSQLQTPSGSRAQMSAYSDRQASESHILVAVALSFSSSSLSSAETSKLGAIAGGPSAQRELGGGPLATAPGP